MVIHFVERLRQVYSTNIYCTAAFNKVIHDATKAANGNITTNTFLETKLVVSCRQKHFKFTKNAMLKHFR